MSDRFQLEKLAGIVVGIPIGTLLGITILARLGLGLITAAYLGCLAGAAIGFLIASLLVRGKAHRADLDLAEAAEAVRKESGLPDTVRIHAKGTELILDGEVAYHTQRIKAGLVMASIPRVRTVTNRLRVRESPPAAA